MRRWILPRPLDNRGVAALEFGFVLPILMVIALGIIDFGRAIWYQATLDYAVQSAARCGAVEIKGTDATLSCYSNAGSSTANIKNYAAGQAFGLSLAATNFAVNTSATCSSGLSGVQVTTTGITFRYLFPIFAGHSGKFSATACYPT